MYFNPNSCKLQSLFSCYIQDHISQLSVSILLPQIVTTWMYHVLLSVIKKKKKKRGWIIQSLTLFLVIICRSSEIWLLMRILNQPWSLHSCGSSRRGICEIDSDGLGSAYPTNVWGGDVQFQKIQGSNTFSQHEFPCFPNWSETFCGIFITKKEGPLNHKFLCMCCQQLAQS